LALKGYLKKTLSKPSFDIHKFLLVHLYSLSINKNGFLQTCVNYHGLKKVIGKKLYSLLLISKLVVNLKQAGIFIEIDL